MSSPDFDQNQVNRTPGNPNQEARDLRIPTVVNELIEATSVMRNPDYDDVDTLVYESADESISVGFHRRQFPRTGNNFLPAEPSEIRYKNQVYTVIPASMLFVVETRVIDDKKYRTSRGKDILLHLNPDDPKIFQIENNDGRFIKSDNKRTSRRARVVEHPELVPPLLDAVSGRKGILKTFRGGLDTPLPRLEWKNTFEPQNQAPTGK